MTDATSESKSSSEPDEGPEASSEHISRLALFVAIAIMLIPAAIPLYFALGAEGTIMAVLVALAVGIAMINTLLVYGIWSWLNSQISQST